MWYTHYLEKNTWVVKLPDTQKNIINTFYKNVLRKIYVRWQSLFDIAMKWYKADYDTDEYKIFDACFHEWQHEVDEPHEPIIFWREDDWFNFTKTARKVYDLPIVLAYTLASYTKAFRFSSDWDVSMFWLDSDNSIAYDIETYCKNELDDEILSIYNWSMPDIINYFYETAAALYDTWAISSIPYQADPIVQPSEPPSSQHKYSIWEEVTYLWSQFKIERLESNKRYKLKHVRWYVKETELNVKSIDEWTEDYTTYNSLKSLDFELIEELCDNIRANKTQCFLSNWMLFEINLLSK